MIIHGDKAKITLSKYCVLEEGVELLPGSMGDYDGVDDVGSFSPMIIGSFTKIGFWFD